MASEPPQSFDESSRVLQLRPQRGASRRSRLGVSIGGDSRVIQFRRGGGSSRGKSSPPISKLDFTSTADLRKYECTENDDDYRHRMTMNALAAAYTTILVLAGVWLLNMLAHS